MENRRLLERMVECEKDANFEATNGADSRSRRWD